MAQRRFRNYVWQSAFAIGIICMLLYLFKQFAHVSVLWAVGAGSLASTCCMVFALPSYSSAKPSSILGGYLIGILVGEVIRLLLEYQGFVGGNFLSSPYFHIIGFVAACSVGISMLLMAMFKFEHPPAVGMSLVLILDLRDYSTLFVVIFGAIVIAIIKYLLRNKLVDLV